MERALALAPLAAPAALFLVALMSRRWRGSRPAPILLASRIASLGSLALALGSGLLVALRGPVTSPVLGVGQAGLAIRLDALSAIMFGLVAFVGVIVVQYSRNYLDGDKRHGDFIGRLCLALGLVFLIVLAGNLVQLIAAWVGASLALHSLLVFYNERPRAIIAGRKKLIAARIGDLCLLGAAVLMAQAFGSSDIATIAERARDATEAVPVGAHVAGALLVVAALLKSAQFPFHSWLPEVMETPTPVSALLHAGMINAGGFLIVRFADVVTLSPSSMALLAAVGAGTALFGSVVMLTQSTVKGSLAYSTMAQMGFMLFECGIGAFSVAVIHIVTHSLYKAHAFLSSGSAIDTAGALGAAKKARRRSPLALAVGAVAGAGLVGTGAALLGLEPLADAPTLGLATILALGVALFVARGATGGGARVAATVLAVSAASVAAFFALEVGALRLLADSVPATSAPTTATLVILGATLLAFAVVTTAQVTGIGRSASSASQRLYVALRNGGYVHALSDRMVGGLRMRDTRRADARGSAAPSSSQFAPGPRLADTDTAVTRERALDAARSAADNIPPLWPLENFVAVNPYLGSTGRSFSETAALLERTAGARSTMTRSFYANAIDEGLLTRSDLAAALERSPARAELGASADELARRARLADRTPVAGPTVADVAGPLFDLDLPRLVTERLADWASGHFDKGFAAWPSPWRSLSPYAAWREYARHDRTPALIGLGSAGRAFGDLPESADDLIAQAAERLEIPPRGLEVYFQRLLHSIGGWAAHARFLGWSDHLAGRDSNLVREMLAVRLSWEMALLDADPRVADAWHIAAPEYQRPLTRDIERDIDLALHDAYETALQRQTCDTFERSEMPRLQTASLSAQVAFCIDVRSERFRRALECGAPEVETLGFAGFFGFPIEWVPVGDDQGGASCPVLLEPKFRVREQSSRPKPARVAQARRRWRRVAAAWKSFKSAAVSSFGFVETMGLGYASKLVTDTLGLTRPVANPKTAGLSKSAAASLRPQLDPQDHDHTHDHDHDHDHDHSHDHSHGLACGMSVEDRIETATGVLRAMSLTERFARLVVLSGHHSTSVNNPYASGLECGACGGRSGEPNARVAAAVLNDPRVRVGLAENGIEVPLDTLFIAAVHDTTTDTVTLCDRDSIPASHEADVADLERRLDAAGATARQERATSLGLDLAADIDSQVAGRGKDWSQVRPEWGLAGCTAFVVAPRHRTTGQHLDGSTFLHNYSWRRDADSSVLELIMTAPMVVASWINLQYFASTVDNRAFGSGNKVLHNVTAGIGVVEGNGGDLRVGLPWQSVHNGDTFVHRPARLSVVIEAPTEAMTDIIRRHESVRQLVDNGWVTLFALDDTGRVSARYAGDLRWQQLDRTKRVAAA